jgi:hypothetical protein
MTRPQPPMAGPRISRRLLSGLAGVALASAACGGLSVEPPTRDAASTAIGDASSSVDGGCLIQVSSYDQSCNVDSDCVSVVEGLPVGSGNYCEPSCICPDEAINRAAAAQFATAVLRTPRGSGAVAHTPCYSCPNDLGPCCVSGKCSTACPCTSPACSSSGPPEDAGAPTSALIPDGDILCSSHTGPIDGAASVGDASVFACGYPEQCVQLNGEWACCTNVGTESSYCRQVPINK